MTNIKTLIKNNKTLVIGSIILLILFLVVLFFPRSVSPTPPGGGSSLPGDRTPPVVKTAPELKLIKVTPLEGARRTFDTFGQTFFEFSADIDQLTAVVTVSPSIIVKTTVYASEKKVLVVEPADLAWSDGVGYTITINPSLRGVAGEVLKQEIKYRFSNTQPAVLEGGDPLPAK